METIFPRLLRRIHEEFIGREYRTKGNELKNERADEGRGEKKGKRSAEER
jgi:hypothetical protein